MEVEVEEEVVEVVVVGAVVVVEVVTAAGSVQPEAMSIESKIVRVSGRMGIMVRMGRVRRQQLHRPAM